MTTEITSTTSASNVSLYTGKETAPANFRVAVFHYKLRKGETTKAASKAVIVPIIAVSCEPIILQSALQECLADMQDTLIRDLIDNKKQTLIAHASIDADALNLWAIEQSNSKRLNKEQIYQWFDASMSDSLTTALCTKLGYGEDATTEQLAKLSASIEVYRNEFGKLSAPLPAINEAGAKQLLKAIELATDGGIKDTLTGKLQLLSTPVTLEMLAL